MLFNATSDVARLVNNCTVSRQPRYKSMYKNKELQKGKENISHKYIFQVNIFICLKSETTIL